MPYVDPQLQQSVPGRITPNGPAQEDERLGRELEQTHKRAADAIDFHTRELQRAKRTAQACKAGLEMLSSPESDQDYPEEGRY